MFRIPTPSKLLHGLPPLPHTPNFRFGGYGPIPGFSSHGIGLGFHNLGQAFSPRGLYQGLGPRGAGGELAAPFVGGGKRIAQGKPPTLAQIAFAASFIPGKTSAGGRAGLISPYTQVMPRFQPHPTHPGLMALTPRQRLMLYSALTAGRRFV